MTDLNTLLSLAYLCEVRIKRSLSRQGVTDPTYHMEKTKAGATSLNRLSSQGKARRESQKKAAASSFSAHSAVIRPRLPARVCSQTSQHWKFNQLARYSSLRGNTEANEWPREIPPSYVDATIATGPIP